MSASIESAARALRFRIDIRHDWHSRLARLERLQERGEAGLRGLHERAMEWGADGQRDHALGACGARELARAGHCVRMSRDDDLTRRVEVRRRDDARRQRGLGVGARARDRVGVEAEHRGHGAFADRNGLLHELPAAANGPQRVREGYRTGRNVCRILAEAVAGRKGRANPPGLREAARGYACRENRRLGVLGEQQPFFGPIEAQPAQRFAERRIGFVERLPAEGKRVGQSLAHADLLRALPGKNECNHRVETTSCASLSSRRSLTHLAAIAMALRTALTDERPWPITQRPSRPMSGAPPYSE